MGSEVKPLRNKHASLDPDDASGTSEYPYPVDAVTYLQDIDCALRIVLGARTYKKSAFTRFAWWALYRELRRKA